MYVHVIALSNRAAGASTCSASKPWIQRLPILIVLLGAGMLAPFGSSIAAKLAFVTSTAGYGILGEWPDAAGNTGLAAGDAICVAHATAANLPEPHTFVAWLSDTSGDAYCRVHGLTGKKSDNCGQSTLPIGAGPWQRTDGVPFMGALTAGSPTAPVYTPLGRDELQRVVNGDLFTGTFANGDASSRNCGNWLVDSDVDFGDTISTYPGWSQFAGYGFCNNMQRHLACLQKGAGDPLPPLPHAHKQAFVTSINFTGNLGAAAQAGGNTGIGAGDAICRNLAQAANVQDAQSYKVYLADGADPAAHFQYDGPWERLDGAPFADSFAQIHDGFVRAPLNMTETGNYITYQFQYAWSGIDDNGGIGFQTCLHWTSTAASGWGSRLDAIGPHWPPAYPVPGECDSAMALYCLSDTDAIFQYGMD